jgi:hypothetical protein
VVVDCANGIGALTLKKFVTFLDNLDIRICNDAGKLNHQVYFTAIDLASSLLGVECHYIASKD